MNTIQCCVSLPVIPAPSTSVPTYMLAFHNVFPTSLSDYFVFLVI